MPKKLLMDTDITQDISEVMEAAHYSPAVSIIMPLTAKIELQKEAAHSLKIAAGKVEQELSKTYPNDVTTLICQKLNHIASDVKFNTGKKSVAIYVSPVFEKIQYLDIPVDERIIIDKSFEIRDLVYSKKQLNKYLVLLLSGNECRLYLCDNATFVSLQLNQPETVYAYVNEVPERVANFTDMTDRKQVVTDKFLRHIDEALGDLLNSYKLPLFVLGPEKIIGHFNLFPQHKSFESHYIHGNYFEATTSELSAVLEPYLEARAKEKEEQVLRQLEEAENKGKLAAGIRNVWQEATHHNARLLVVEKNYMHAAQAAGAGISINKMATPEEHHLYVRDAVDEVIEEVLKNGGDVDFVDENILKNYQHIALIQHY